ncbi:MAG: ATP12 family protein [Pseudolabrys sp.]|nr:ATP12 family protein [Pseudolabrys sp.]MDP2299064.1 ATP12 family protein [Pseudolabrys sp.]
MREFIEEIFINQPLDPMVSARQGARASLRKRFYKQAQIGEPVGENTGAGFPLLLDGKQVMTPARKPLVAPVRELAEAMAQEWESQVEVIDPFAMPLTRIANVIIDGVAKAPMPVIEEIVQYLGSDLVCYRADTPPGLVERQKAEWDPVLAWARDTLGARFILIEGIVYAAQPEAAIAAASAGIPSDVWRLGAVASIMTLTGSALIALAVNAGALGPAAAWKAAHVDEDYQMSQWGLDDMTLERREGRFAEYMAAATVLKHLES